MKSIAAQVPLMDPRHIPRGEVQWTCRVWVKEVLRGLQRHQVIELPGTIGRFMYRETLMFTR